MNNADQLIPEKLFDEFRQQNVDVGRAALDRFSELTQGNKRRFLEPTIQFLKAEQQDVVRSWGTSVLAEIGSEEAFQVLVSMLTEGDVEQKQNYRYTRFFALRALEQMASTENQRRELRAIIDRLAQDKDEQGLVWAGSTLLLARQREGQAEATLMATFTDQENFWGIHAVLRALREFPFPRLTDEVVSVMREAQYIDLQYDAIQALAASAYKDDVKVVRALGEVVVTAPDRYLRLGAVESLASLQNRAALTDLLQALQDDDAEIRVQATKALLAVMDKEEAISTIVQQSLRKGLEEQAFHHLVDTLRLIDPERAMTTEVLSKELASEDRERAQVAERILLDLGGWAAVQRLSQRRSTLDVLDRHLTESERIVKTSFEDTVRQARRNFYFAMAINVAVVIVGLILVGMALVQLTQDPSRWETWVLPGATGVFGVLISLLFNNPRRNAREDLSTLMNVNILFLGFLRQLNEIDATFKYAYLEHPDFGTAQMRETVHQIDLAVTQTLNRAAHHLHIPKKSPDVETDSGPESSG